MACLLTEIHLNAAGDLEESNLLFSIWITNGRMLQKKRKLFPLLLSELLNISSFLCASSTHLSDRQHSVFCHGQMIWSFNLLMGLQAVFHINHTELLLHRDFSSLKRKNRFAYNKSSYCTSTDLATCAILAPQLLLESSEAFNHVEH